MTPESLVVVDSAGHWAQLRCDLLEGVKHAQATPLPNINEHQTQTTQKERVELDTPLKCKGCLVQQLHLFSPWGELSLVPSMSGQSLAAIEGEVAWAQLWV